MSAVYNKRDYLLQVAVMATVAVPEDHDSFDVSDIDSNPLGVYYEAIYNSIEDM